MGYGDGSVFKNDRGGWTMFATIDGKRYKRTGATKTEARAKVSELRKQLALGPRAAASALTVAAMLDEWFKKDLKTKDRSPSTVERHRWAVDRIKAEIGKKQAATLKVRQVEDMLDNLQADGLGRSSLTKVLQTLSQAFDAAMRREDLDRNVAKLAKIPEAATRTAERTSLSPAEARKLLEALHDERNGLMLALSLRLGLRPGEAAGLFWEDVGTDAVNVTRGTVRHGGVTVVSDDLKTSKAKRTVELPPDLVAWFADHRRTQAAERLAATSWGDERLVFTGKTGNVISASTIRKQLAAVCKRAEVPAITPNELRHSCASLLSDEGVPNELIADLLGHTTTRMVDETYRHRLRPVVSVAAQANWSTAN